MTFPVFDLHCDTANRLLGKQCDEVGSLRSNQLHIDLERAKTLTDTVSALLVIPPRIENFQLDFL